MEPLNNNTKDMEFAARLTQLRLKLPLRNNKPVFKKDVAVEAGISVGSHSLAENGVTPKAAVLYKLATYFNVTVDYLEFGQADRVVEETPLYQGSKLELQDGEGLYGKTRRREVEGTHLTITEFKPKEGQVKGPLRAAIEGLGEIFDSKDPVLIPTIEAVIHAARISAQREYQNKQQARQIKALEDESNEFKKRLENLERKLEDNPPHDHKEVPTKQKAI